MPEPGVYLINSTGETTPLLTESGGGDLNLLIEVLDNHGYGLTFNDGEADG